MRESNKTVVGLDVHKETITVAVLTKGQEKVGETWTIENRPTTVEKLMKRVGPEAEYVYEAGPCGYALQRQMVRRGETCWVVAPGLIPKRAADRVKTDRRDAEKLARLWRAGELTTVRVPSESEEAGRDLVRAREDALADQQRARRRLSAFLLRQGRVYRETHGWQPRHWKWLGTQKFESVALQQTFEISLRSVQEAEARRRTLDQQIEDLAKQEPYRIPVSYLRCFKGLETLGAMTLLVEAQVFWRFERATGFMSYTGLTGSEHSSGGRVCRGGITKAGNAHVRRILVESAWSYRHRNVVSRALAGRREGCPASVVQLARRAQDRLHRRYHRMLSRNKPAPVTVVAVARELAGFVWAMAQHFPKAEAV